MIIISDTQSEEIGSKMIIAQYSPKGEIQEIELHGDLNKVFRDDMPKDFEINGLYFTECLLRYLKNIFWDFSKQVGIRSKTDFEVFIMGNIKPTKKNDSQEEELKLFK